MRPSYDGRDFYLCPLVRAYRDRPTRLDTTSEITLKAELDCQALASAKRLLGWRIYLTNQAASVLSWSEAVLAYRDEYIIEHRIGRLKAFDYITLTVIKTGAACYYHLTPLSELQRRILEALDLGPQIYSRLMLQFPKPP